MAVQWVFKEPEPFQTNIGVPMAVTFGVAEKQHIEPVVIPEGSIDQYVDSQQDNPIEAHRSLSRWNAFLETGRQRLKQQIRYEERSPRFQQHFNRDWEKTTQALTWLVGQNQLPPSPEGLTSKQRELIAQHIQWVALTCCLAEPILDWASPSIHWIPVPQNTLLHAIRFVVEGNVLGLTLGRAGLRSLAAYRYLKSQSSHADPSPQHPIADDQADPASQKQSSTHDEHFPWADRLQALKKGMSWLIQCLKT